MSNRPKGFKRMPKFYITGFNHKNDKAIIKSFDERLPNDEYHHRLINQAKMFMNGGLCNYHKHIGSKSLSKILNIIRNWH